jgi:hypothetical protein
VRVWERREMGVKWSLGIASRTGIREPRDGG